jgi:predicted metal-dependent phosphoesterase TrpH
MRNTQKYQTLHGHTTTSDGKLTHLEALDMCQKYNIGVYAFTDHDALPDKKIISLLRKNNNHQTRWILSIEVSSGWPLDLGGGATSGLHITGHFANPFDKQLIKHCKLAQEARVVRMQKIVNNLQNLGFDITENDCLKESGGEAVGRPHVVKAVSRKKRNLRITENLRQKMQKDSRKDSRLKEKYDQMMEQGESQYPYSLFLSEDSYIKDVYVDYQYYSDFDRSVSLIRNAGGLAFLAHWFTCRRKITEQYLNKLLDENRLDGVDVVYGLFARKLNKWPEFKNEQRILRRLVKKYNKLEGGGFDAHTNDDFVRFSKDKKYAEKTIGLAEEIINKSKIDTTWSSI